MTFEGHDADGRASAEDGTPGSEVGKSTIRGGAFRVAGYFVGVIVSTFAAALLFRHLGVVTTGHYVTALSLVAIVAAISDLGLTAVGVREIATGPENERWRLASDLLGLKLSMTILGGLIVTVIAWVAYSPELAAGVAVGIVGLALTTAQDNYAISLVIETRFTWIAALDLLRNVLSAALTMLFVAVGARFVPFLAISIPVGVMLVIATVVVTRAHRSLLPTFDPRRWRDFVGRMLPYAAAIAASALYYRFSILLVSAFSSSTQLGYFSASFRIIEVLTTVPLLLVSTAFPFLVRTATDDSARFNYAMRRVFEVSLIAGVWVAVSLAVSAPLAISLIGGPTFQSAAEVLALQGIGLGATFINVTWSYGLLSLGRYRAILAVNSSALILNVAVVIPLVLADGARGAAIGTSITEVVVAGVQGVVFARVQAGFRINARVVPRILAAAALSLLPVALTGLPVLGRLGLSAVIFVLVILVLRAIPAEVLELLPIRGRRARFMTNGPRP